MLPPKNEAAEPAKTEEAADDDRSAASWIHRARRKDNYKIEVNVSIARGISVSAPSAPHAAIAALCSFVIFQFLDV